LPALPPPLHDQSAVHINFVDDAAGLDRALQALAPAPTLYLDTEFHAERRYAPQLLLVQIAAGPDAVWVIDPLHAPLAALGPALQGKTWAAHGASVDLRLLHAHTGARPARLLDTQLLGGLAGARWPAQLGALCARFLGDAPEKGQALTDWSARPLRADQLRYAVEDVLSVIRLTAAPALQPRRGWALDLGDELIESALQEPNPDEAWISLDVAAELDAPTRAALHQLCAWREATARARDLPPHQLLPLAQLLDLARRRPAELEGLRANRRLPRSLIQRDGAEILAELAAARRAPATPEPVAPAIRARSTRLQAWAEAVGAELGIAPGLLLPPGLAIALAAGESPAIGWREAAIGGDLQAYLQGRTGLTVDGRRAPI
jgi:ribonuclease D